MLQFDTMQKVSDLQLLEKILELPGATDTELGEYLGLSRVQVCRRRNDPKFRAMVEGQFKDSFETLRSAHVKAVRTVCRAMDSEDDRIALKSAALVCQLVREGPPDEAVKAGNWFDGFERLSELIGRSGKKVLPGAARSERDIGDK
jgi:hypothetical protein